LLSLRWSQVHLDLAEIVFDDTKNHEDFRIRLTAPAIAILKAIPRVSGSDYVFPNRRSDAKRPHMSAPRNAWEAVRVRAGVGRRVTFHDVRRSMGTALARAGYTAEQIAALLNHKSPVTAKHYIRIASDTQQRMAEELAKLGTVVSAAANAGTDQKAPT
jgi:integrase